MLVPTLAHNQGHAGSIPASATKIEAGRCSGPEGTFGRKEGLGIDEGIPTPASPEIPVGSAGKAALVP